MTDRRGALLVFAKSPEKGKVKTRLAKDLGEEKAFEIYLSLLEHIKNVSGLSGIDRILAYSGRFNQQDPFFPADSYIAQKGNDLGERMHNALLEAIMKYKTATVLIGVDLPGLTTDILQNAFDLLNSNDVVIGPAEDGGYYLIGMKEAQWPLFQNMSWSHSKVLEDTLKRCEQLGLSYDFVDRLNDIDTFDDWKNSDFS